MKGSTSRPSSFSAALGACCALALCGATCLLAGDPKPEPDVLIFNNGEKLIGHLERARGGSLTFKSDMAGEIAVDWSKVKELHTSVRFAVIPKDVKLSRKADAGQVPRGSLSVSDQKMEIVQSPGAGSRALPIADAQTIVDEPSFEKTISTSPGFFHDWKGGLTGGASLVEATQKSRTFTGSINLIRAEPTVDWLEPRNRTTANFTASYGKLSQPDTPDVKTEIYHADAERDEYFSPRVFAFGQLAYDHNFSQGLDLEQLYGGGIGITVIKNANSELDLKGSASYIRQQFTGTTTGQDQNLIGATFSDQFSRKFAHGVLLTQALTVTPTFNNFNAYTAAGSAGLLLPVFKRLGITVNVLDTFINDPPPLFKKNSFQFTTGLTYTLP